jgi:hypothetical protein
MKGLVQHGRIAILVFGTLLGLAAAARPAAAQSKPAHSDAGLRSISTGGLAHHQIPRT